MTVREKPPLRTMIRARAPNGREHRWGGDSPDPADAPQDVSWGSTIPGGWESLDCKLVRQPGIDYADLQPLSTLRIEGVGGRCAGEYRLERTPRVSGDQLAVSPSAVGWQAALEDDKTVRQIYVDTDLSHWTGPTTARKLAAIGFGYASIDPSTRPDPIAGQPALDLQVTGAWSGAARSLAEAWYDIGPGCSIAALYYGWRIGSSIVSTDTLWEWRVRLSTDDAFTAYTDSGNLRAAGPGSGSLAADVAARWAQLQLTYGGAGGDEGKQYDVFFMALAVIGDHGVTLRDGPGVFESDVCVHAVNSYAPPITADPANIDETTGFVIPHLAFWDNGVSAGEIVRQATRFSLADWAVWEHARIAQPQFHLHARGGHGKRWRARVGPTGLEETGPQVDRLWASIVVQFQDVAGRTRTVGPPGSGADTEDAALVDTDPQNPANIAGSRRRDLLTMGTSTPQAAVKVGATFLAQSKLLDTSGRAQLKGWVVDDSGVLHPYWAVRAGDYISFVDAHDTAYRRIVKATNSERDYTCSIDLDSPPEGLQSLLERLSVGLIQLGLT